MLLDILMVVGIMTVAFYLAYGVVVTSKKFKPVYQYYDPTISVYLAMKEKRNRF